MNQYWSLSGPVLVANSDQYSSDRRPVLVDFSSSEEGNLPQLKRYGEEVK